MEDREDDEGKGHLRRQTKVSLNDALKAALNAKSGTAVEAELERENGHLVYSVTVVDVDGKIFKVKVDAGAGKVQKIDSD